MKNLRKDRLIKLVLATFLVAFFIYTVANITTQKQRLANLRTEKEMLQKNKEKVIVETEGAKRMIEYSKSDEYKEQYARERFGWVKKGELKFVNSQDEQNNFSALPNEKLNEQEVLVGQEAEKTQETQAENSPQPQATNVPAQPQQTNALEQAQQQTSFNIPQETQ